ncbi:MAG: hypothetical protein HN888_10120, partial [Desulfobacula sp.]|nr:hypothetical protein [Desulfobacula sp.]
MTNKKEQISTYIVDLLSKSTKPRNQIAAISGLSNTYIKQLEKGNFISVRREKLIAFGVALSLSLNEIDNLLNFFDRTPLSSADITTILEMSNLKMKSTALLPLKNGFPLELAILSAERLDGHLSVLYPEPTFCLYPKGFRQYSERMNVARHALYNDLVEAINSERNRVFYENLEKSDENSYTQYICKNCLEDYVLKCDDPKEKKYRNEHIEMIISALRKYKNFQFYIINHCPTMSFTLKQTSVASKDTDKLFIVFWPRHLKRGRRSGRLSGFTTDNDVVIQNYRDEIDVLSSTKMEEYQNKN